MRSRVSGKSGFTLIEITIALFIGLALFAFAAGIVRMGMKEGELARLRDDAGLLARRARALAMESGVEQEMIIEADRWVLESGEESSPFPRTLEFPPGVKVEVQVWPSDRWIVPDKGISWLFQPNGICMPLGFRFSQGELFVSFRIHPLTGAVDQESRMIQGEK